MLLVLRGALAINRFPTFCGVLVGGSTLLELPIQRLLVGLFHALHFPRGQGTAQRLRVFARFLATAIAAYSGLALLNSTPGPAPHSHGVSATVRERAIGPLCTASLSGELASSVDLPKVLGGPLVAIPSSALNVFLGEPRLAGRTIDLTLFAVTRATDVLVGELWARRKTSRIAKGRWTSLESTIGQLTDAVVFAGSASLVMWAWFYLPDRLPRAYNKWIGDAAEVDARLVTALRRARLGEFFYGKNTGQAPMLQGMCRDYGLPLEYGDPATCIPLPCEVVHMGTGTSCEVHAVSRFLRAYRFSLAMYLPLNLLIKARSLSGRAIQQAVKDALRSSAFLAAFISLFYYGICLARTRLGPRLLSRYGFTAQDWDAGLGVGAGCTLCGWSILIEAERRRQEIALFVAPRAAATFFPRRYDPKVPVSPSLRSP